MNKKIDRPVILFGLEFFGGQMDELLGILTQRLTQPSPEKDGCLTLVTPNPEQVVLTRSNPLFLTALQKADVRIPDGIGLVYSSKMYALLHGFDSLSQRLAGKTVVSRLLAWLQDRAAPVLVIGGRSLGEGVDNSSVVDRAQRLKPVFLGQGSAVVTDSWFWTEGYAHAESPTDGEETQVRTVIRQLQPKLVLVAFGAPHQELWLESHRAFLAANNVRVAMAVGGAFDVLTGSLKQPPVWMEKAGLEWLFRLWQEPWRWRRQLQLLQFMKIALLEISSRSKTN